LPVSGAGVFFLVGPFLDQAIGGKLTLVLTLLSSHHKSALLFFLSSPSNPSPPSLFPHHTPLWKYRLTQQTLSHFYSPSIPKPFLRRRRPIAIFALLISFPLKLSTVALLHAMLTWRTWEKCPWWKIRTREILDMVLPCFALGFRKRWKGMGKGLEGKGKGRME